MVRVDQQRIQHRAQNGAVSAVLLECLPHVLFQFLVSFPHVVVHRNTDVALFVGRQFVGNIFEKDKGTKLHEKFAKQKRRCSWLAPNAACCLCFRASVIRWFYLGNGFKNTIVLGEGTSSRRTPLVSVLLHLAGLKPEQRVEQIVRETTEKGASQTNNATRTSC